MKKIGAIAAAVALTCCAWATPAYAFTSSDIPNPPENIPLVPPSQLSSDLGTTGMMITAPFNQAPGAIRKEFGVPGPHTTAATITTRGCGPFYQFYNTVIRLNHGVTSPAGCYGTQPEGNLPAFGYQFIYPNDLAPGQKVPVLFLSPGIGTEPGMMHRHAEFYASHGYAVVLGYSFFNWFGEQFELAAHAANHADQDPKSPLYQHLDFSNIVLAGHSAGGGSAIRVAGTLDGLLRNAGHPEAKIKGAIGINPGPSDFSLASPPSPVPTMVLAAEHESLVAYPLSRVAFDKATGPKWWAIVRNAEHGSYLDAPNVNIYDSLVVSFSDYVTNGDAAASHVYTGDDYLLGKDSELTGVERYGI